MFEISEEEKGWWKMISYDRILAEIERQLNTARRSADESEMREALAAIRSLSEVALSGSSGEPEKIVPKMLKMNEVQSLTSLEAKPMVEKGANGGSIFDF